MKLEDEIKQKSFKGPYHRMVVNVMFTGNWMQKELLNELKPFDLSLQQHNVLSILRGQYPTPSTLGLIQKRMMDKMSNATRLVDKLLEKKLVQRCQCPENRRKVDILITQTGLDLLQKIDATLKSIDTKYAHLTETEAITLANLLDKLRE